MIESVVVNPPEKVKSYLEVKIAAEGTQLNGFPFLSINKDSYIVQAEIHSSINFRPEFGCHCISIGKGCSIADGVVFMIDQNHDYNSVFQGNLAFVDRTERKTPRKGSIIIQNDVWIGSCATIMAGVTLHNGCIVAARSVVTKDVPPYAIVGGNPAAIIRYRFDNHIVQSLQKIAWWDWPESVQQAHKEDMLLPVEQFVEKCMPEITPDNYSGYSEEQFGLKKIVLFPADIDEPFPLYPQILESFFEKDRPNTELLIYLPEECSKPENIQKIEHILQKYKMRDCYVTLQAGTAIDEHILFQMADYYVTTRGQRTVQRTCLADLYQVKILYGTDAPVFPSDME